MRKRDFMLIVLRATELIILTTRNDKNETHIKEIWASIAIKSIEKARSVYVPSYYSSCRDILQI